MPTLNPTQLHQRRPHGVPNFLLCAPPKGPHEAVIIAADGTQPANGNTPSDVRSVRRLSEFVWNAKLGAYVLTRSLRVGGGQ